MAYFDYCTGLRMTNSDFAKLFGLPVRNEKEPLTQTHMDLAASIQKVTEEVVLKLTRAIARDTGIANLCLAGGVALNCVANGKVLRDGAFKNIWIQPAAGDAGGALGAALAVYYGMQKKPRHVTPGKDSMQGGYLGCAFTQEDIEQKLNAIGAVYERLDDDALLTACTTDLEAGKALGWFQGRMEFGPRALGGRSILGDARNPDMQKNLNLKVKFRESFRPFAPSVRSEDAADWFDLSGDSPYMLLVAEVAQSHRRTMSSEEEALFGIEKLNVARSDIPAVTHVDYSARIQTVHADTNPRYHALLTRFKERTGCPVLVNTSFNVRGEPIVGSPEDAFRCFMGTGIESLAIGNCYLRKEKQNMALAENYTDKFGPD